MFPLPNVEEVTKLEKLVCAWWWEVAFGTWGDPLEGSGDFLCVCGL